MTGAGSEVAEGKLFGWLFPAYCVFTCTDGTKRRPVVDDIMARGGAPEFIDGYVAATVLKYTG